MMDMDEAPFVRSDPYTSIAVPEQFIRIDLAVVKESISIDWTADRVRFDFVGNELLEACVAYSNQYMSLIGCTEVADRPWYAISFWWTGLPLPNSGLCTNP